MSLVIKIKQNKLLTNSYNTEPSPSPPPLYYNYKRRPYRLTFPSAARRNILEIINKHTKFQLNWIRR